MKKNKLTYIIVAAATIIYHLSPFDIIPDVIPLMGQIDDVITALIPLIMGYRSIARERN